MLRRLIGHLRFGLSAIALVAALSAQSENASLQARYEQLVRFEAGMDGGSVGEHINDAVALKAKLDGMGLARATIATRRDIAAILREERIDASALHHLRDAVEVAGELEDPAILLTLYMDQLEIYVDQSDRTRGLPTAGEAIRLAEFIGDNPSLVTATLHQIALEKRRSSGQGQTNRELAYDRLLQLDGVDPFAIKLHRGRFMSAGFSTAPLQEERWREILTLAQQRAEITIETEAWLRLAWLAYNNDKSESAVQRFQNAFGTDVPVKMNAQEWRKFVRFFDDLGLATFALDQVELELQRQEGSAEIGFLAELHDAQAWLLAADGNVAGAYDALRIATELRSQKAFEPEFLAMGKLVGAVEDSQLDSARTDAAIRTHQREIELKLARTERQNLIIAIIAAVFLILLLTAAYQLKRRATYSAQIAREAAELRAENADLLALRYQLNPHFLFNALEGLGSRFSENAQAGLSLLERLTEFCRLVFIPHDHGLQSLGEECTMIESFLHIEKDRWEENLQIKLDFDPAANARPLPTMLIHPLVENALKYGAETSTNRILISVTTKLIDDDTLCVTVSNSGRWLESQAPRERSSHRVGLNNIRRRLASYYPEHHTFEIGPSEVGVTATLTLHGPPTVPSDETNS